MYHELYVNLKENLRERYFLEKRTLKYYLHHPELGDCP